MREEIVQGRRVVLILLNECVGRSGYEHTKHDTIEKGLADLFSGHCRNDCLIEY